MCIVNLYPSLEDYLPTDLDSIRDREIDIKFHDRTKYDEQMAHIVTDYITFVRSVMDIALSQAKDKRLLRDEVQPAFANRELKKSRALQQT